MAVVDSVSPFRLAGYPSLVSRFAAIIATALIVLLSLCQGRCVTADGKTRVAIVDFRPSSLDLQELQELQKLVALVQANLARELHFEWVERNELARAERELYMASSGILSANSELRVGKWVKADWLIAGEVRGGAGASRLLHIEVLELARADVLASADLEIDSVEKLVLQESKHTRVTEHIRDLLTKAAARLKEVRGRTAIAPLFFRNQEAGGRLAYFEKDLQKAFVEADRTEGKIRVLQFRRAGESRQEAELAIASLTENAGEAEQQLADIYVWGTFAEQNPSGTPFPDVPVKVEVSLWQEGHLRKIYGFAPVRELSKLAEDIVRQVCAGGSQITERARPLSREALATEFYDRAQELIYENFGPYLAKVDEAWHRRRLDAMKLLEIACFLDPKNVKAERELLLERWRDDVSMRGRELSATLQSSSEWRRHFEKHGFAYKQPWMRKKPNAIYTDHRAPFSNNETILIWTQLEVLETMARIREYNPQSPQLKAALQAVPWIAHEEELLRRVEVALASNAGNLRQSAGRFLADGLAMLETPTNDVRLIELLHQFDPTSQFSLESVQTLLNAIRKAYTAVGKPERAEIIISGWKAPEPAKQAFRSTPPPVELLPPLDESQLPPKIVPETRFIGFGNNYRFRGILALGWHQDRLWVSTEAADVEEPETPSAVWTYTPGTKRPQRLLEHFRDDPQVSGFLSGPAGAFWITSSTQGAWCITPTSPIPARVEERDGLQSLVVLTSGTNGELLYFGGGTDSTGKLSLFSPKDQTWAALTMDFKIGKTGHPPVQVKQLAAYKNWLLVYGDSASGGYRLYNFLYDRDTGLWRDLEQVCIPASPVIAALPERSRTQRFRITSATSDETGFWIGSRSGIVLYQPESDTSTDLHLPNRSGGGEVTAMAHDGDYLWVAAHCRRSEWVSGVDSRASSHLFVLHKPSRKWLGCIELPKDGSVQSLAIGPKHVWVGFNYVSETITYTSKPPILEIQKGALPWKQR